MTTISVTPETDIETAVAAHGGPGVTVLYAPGRYRHNLRLLGEVARHNGAPGAPMRFVSEVKHGATIEAAVSSDDPFHMLSARDVLFDGFRVLGPSDATRQAFHAHAEPKKGTYSQRVSILNCRIYRRGGDGIKLSEVVGGLIEGNEFFDDRVPEGAKESSIDCNKSDDIIIRRNWMRDPNTAIIFKGGGQGLILEENDILAWKGIEFGGHEGTGPADGFYGNWAAKVGLFRRNTINGSEYPVRFIGAHEVVLEDNELTGGDIMVSESRQAGGRVHVCSDISVDGRILVPVTVVSDPDAYRPVTTPPAAPEPQPEPEPETDDTDTFAKGETGKATYSVGANDLPPITLVGFDLDAAGLENIANVKSDSLVIIDLRKSGGPQLTLKGKSLRDRWLDAFIFA